MHVLTKGTAKHYLVLLIFFFSFTPFFSPIPTVSDLQPVSLFLILILIVIDKNMWSINRQTLVFSVFAVMSFVYVNPENMIIDYRKALGLPAAVLGYHFFRKYSLYLNQRILFVVVCVNFVSVLIHFIDPSFFISTLGYFVREIKMVDVTGVRGAAGFAAEPGFMGALAVFYIAVSVFIKSSKGETCCFVLTLLLSLLIIVMTKSGSGFLFLFLFVFLFVFKVSLKNIFIGFVLLFVIYVGVDNFDFGRGGYTIRMLFDNPQHLFLIDTSVGQRVINILTGILAPLHFPFGYGWGGFEYVFEYIDEIYSLTDFVSGDHGNVSAFSLYSSLMGVFYYIFILYFVVLVFRVKRNFSPLPYLGLAALMHISSFSVAFPPVWFLFAVMHASYAKENLKTRASERK